MPSDGVLALCADDPECLALRDAATSVGSHIMGVNTGSDWWILQAHEQDGMQRFRVSGGRPDAGCHADVPGPAQRAETRALR